MNIKKMKYYNVIAIIILMVLFLYGTPTFGAEPVDTIPFTASYTIVEDNTVNSKGNPTKKYYILSEGYLYPTNKTTTDKIKLCQKHNAKIKLYAVVTRKNKTVKRIITI